MGNVQHGGLGIATGQGIRQVGGGHAGQHLIHIRFQKADLLGREDELSASGIPQTLGQGAEGLLDALQLSPENGAGGGDLNGTQCRHDLLHAANGGHPLVGLGDLRGGGEGGQTLITLSRIKFQFLLFHAVPYPSFFSPCMVSPVRAFFFTLYYTIKSPVRQGHPPSFRKFSKRKTHPARYARNPTAARLCAAVACKPKDAFFVVLP